MARRFPPTFAGHAVVTEVVPVVDPQVAMQATAVIVIVVVGAAD